MTRIPAKRQRTDLIPGGMGVVVTNCFSSVSPRHQTSTTPHDTVHWCVGSGSAVRTRGGEEKCTYTQYTAHIFTHAFSHCSFFHKFLPPSTPAPPEKAEGSASSKS